MNITFLPIELQENILYRDKYDNETLQNLDFSFGGIGTALGGSFVCSVLVSVF